MTEPVVHPLPVHGYTAQSQTNVELANEAKELEERVQRFIDKLFHRQENGVMSCDPRNLALARTYTEEAFMRIVRSIFKPQRIRLPDDDKVDDSATTIAIGKSTSGA